MGIQEFAQKICDAVERELGGGCHAQMREVRKNNGILRQGLLIHRQGQNVSPTIYLESYLESYEEGVPLAEIVRRVLCVYRESMPRDSVDMAFFCSFEKVKDRICYRLVGRKGNESLLEDVPHIDFLDLAVCFYYAYQGKKLGEGSILIYNSHMEMWETTTADLLKVAESNTPRLFPWVCSSMEEVIAELADEEEMPGDCGAREIARDFPMQVLSNAGRTQGAACMIYPGVLERLAAERRCSFYILPSSIHEVLLLPEDIPGTAEDLKRMIAEVNCTQVAPEEVLSDSLYYYDFLERRVKIIF